MEKIFYLGTSPYSVEDSFLLHDLEEEEIVGVFRDIRGALQQEGWECVINKRKRDYFEQNLEGEEFLPPNFGYKEKDWDNPVELHSVLKFKKGNMSIMISTGFVYDGVYDFSGYGFTPFDDITQNVKVWEYALSVKTDDKELMKKIGEIVEKYTIPCENEENLEKLSKGITKAVNKYLVKNVKPILIDKKKPSSNNLTK